MKREEKLRILADAAKYDASCSSSGSTRANTSDGIGDSAFGGICHSWAADGRCVSLLKVLLSNQCLYDCKYCLSRRSNDIERATFAPEELADIVINFYRRNYIEGLFLSSAVFASAEKTMADMVEVCELLRNKYRFNGYIHLKVIPGVSRELVELAGMHADRLSVNIELPSESSLKSLPPQKTRASIISPMRQIGETCSELQKERKRIRGAPQFCPAGQTTQMIVGASQETDFHILGLAEKLYQKMALKRVYYSAYIPINNDQLLPAVNSAPPLIREHRLYQADWLLRFYRFNADEILSPEYPELDEKIDPKAAWALRNFDLFPIDINRAPYELLLRVPGLGVKSAQRIIKARRVTALREEDLKKIGLVLKRARHFLTINGRYLGDLGASQEQVKQAMQKMESAKNKKIMLNSKQLKLFV